MPGQVTVPILPCRCLDDIVPFYEALGFTLTYRQQRPNPYACLRFEDIDLHFFAVSGFKPEDSMGSVIVLVPDVKAFHDHLSTGLRTYYGRLPVSGIPRITRPRRQQGESYGGFSLVDPGGNWLRVSTLGGVPDGGSESFAERAESGGLTRAIATAARQANAHGDVGAGIVVLDAALRRHASLPAAERLPALVFRAELAVRAGDEYGARTIVDDILAMRLTSAERTALAEELAFAEQMQADLPD